ncbi:hypothetical protein DC522_31885 [Microvirga sp. KLBC 81]|nr:hypothetical protein DC522_31885 [Microvirga sp. KLBC 81]
MIFDLRQQMPDDDSQLPSRRDSRNPLTAPALDAQKECPQPSRHTGRCSGCLDQHRSGIDLPPIVALPHFAWMSRSNVA